MVTFQLRRRQTRNNADGNREIFLLDYAQRRIFQITNTKNVPNPPAITEPNANQARVRHHRRAHANSGADAGRSDTVKIEIDNRLR
jgi:hypothetical protein